MRSRTSRYHVQSSADAPIGATRDIVAEYIAQMTAELAEIAATAELDLLTYFLKMAQLEAESLLRGDRG